MAEVAFGFVFLQEVFTDLFQLSSTLVRESPAGSVGLDNVQSFRVLNKFLPFQLSH